MAKLGNSLHAMSVTLELYYAFNLLQSKALEGSHTFM